MDDTKERIRSIALARFAERGYNAVGIQEICLLSGVTKPTLYYYFASKRGLLETIAGDEYGAFLAAVEQASAYEGDLSKTLIACMRVSLRFASEKPDFMRLRLSLSFSPLQSEEHEIMRPYSERLYEAFKRLFRRAAEDHGNMRGRELAYAASFIATSDAYAGLALADAFLADDDFVKRAVHYYMHGIFS